MKKKKPKLPDKKDIEANRQKELPSMYEIQRKMRELEELIDSLHNKLNQKEVKK